MRAWLPWLLIALMLGLVVGLAFIPSGSLPGPGCQIRDWTGLHCPGCGGTRAARHLLHAQWVEAARCNLMIYPVVIASLWACVAFIARRFWDVKWWSPARLGWVTMWILLGLLVIFTVIRNLEAASFLRP